MTANPTRISWVAQTEDALHLARNANEAERQFTDLQEAKDSLGKLLIELKRLAEGAAVARSFGWPGSGGSPELFAQLRRAAETLDQRPINHSVRALADFKSVVKEGLIDQWRAFAAERMGNVAELRTLAQTLRSVDGVAELSTRLEAVLGQLALAQDSVPSAASLGLLQEAEAVLRDLEASFQPELVRKFLTAVARGGAPLKMLGSDVDSWLNSHHAALSFKIVAGPPVEIPDD
jgi:hypothetical protein